MRVLLVFVFFSIASLATPSLLSGSKKHRLGNDRIIIRTDIEKHVTILKPVERFMDRETSFDSEPAQKRNDILTDKTIEDSSEEDLNLEDDSEINHLPRRIIKKPSPSMVLPVPESQNVENAPAANQMFRWSLNNYMQRKPTTLSYPVMGQSQWWNTNSNIPREYWVEHTTPYMDNIQWWTINPNIPLNYWTAPMIQHLDFTEETNQNPWWNIKNHIPPMNNMEQTDDDTTKNNKPSWMSYKNNQMKNQFPWWQFKKNTPMKDWMHPTSSPMDDSSTNSWTRINKHFPMRQIEPESQGMKDNPEYTHMAWSSINHKTPQMDQVLQKVSDTSKTDDIPVIRHEILTNKIPQISNNYNPSQNMIDEENDYEIDNNWKQNRNMPSMWWTKVAKYNPKFNMMLQRTENMSPWWKCKSYPCFRQIDNMKHPLKIKTKEPVQGDEI